MGVAKLTKDKVDEVLEKIAAVCHGCFKAEICDIPINNYSDVSETEFCFSFDIEDNYPLLYAKFYTHGGLEP